MTDPLEDAVRATLAEQASARNPVLDLTSLNMTARRRRRRRRAALAGAGMAAVLLAAPAIIYATDPPADSLVADGAVEATSPDRLADDVAAALRSAGHKPEGLISQALPPGSLGTGDLGQLGEGRRRLAGARASARVEVGPGEAWQIVVVEQRLSPPLGRPDVADLALALGAGSGPPIRESAGGAVYGAPQGVRGVRIEGDLLVTVGITTGAPVFDAESMAELARGLADAVR